MTSQIIQVLALLSIAMLTLCVASGVATFAQEGGSNEGEERQTTQGRLASARRPTEKFAKAQEFMDAEAARLGRVPSGSCWIRSRTRRTCRPAEAIQLYQLLRRGLFLSMEKLPTTRIRAFETMLAQQEDLEPRRAQPRRRLHAGAAAFPRSRTGRASIRHSWTSGSRRSRIRRPNPLIELLASAYYQLERYDEMIAPDRTSAIRISPASVTRRSRRSWWLLLRVAYYEQGRRPENVVEILEIAGRQLAQEGILEDTVLHVRRTGA